MCGMTDAGGGQRRDGLAAGSQMVRTRPDATCEVPARMGAHLLPNQAHHIDRHPGELDEQNVDPR